MAAHERRYVRDEHDGERGACAQEVIREDERCENERIELRENRHGERRRAREPMPGDREA